MSKHLAVAAPFLDLGLLSGQAWVKAEGVGDPFALNAAPEISRGLHSTLDLEAECYPAPAVSPVEPSELAQFKLGPSNGAPVQTANSLSRGCRSTHACFVDLARYQEAGALLLSS